MNSRKKSSTKGKENHFLQSATKSLAKTGYLSQYFTKQPLSVTNREAPHLISHGSLEKFEKYDQKDQIIKKLLKKLTKEKVKNQKFQRKIMEYESQIETLQEIIRKRTSGNKSGASSTRSKSKSMCMCKSRTARSSTSKLGRKRRNHSRCSGVNCSKSHSNFNELTESTEFLQKPKRKGSKKSITKKSVYFNTYEAGDEYFTTNQNDFKLSELGFINNNISEISLRSSRDTYNSIAFETAKFQGDPASTLRPSTSVSNNMLGLSKQSLITLSKDLDRGIPVNGECILNAPQHKRIQSASSSVISTAKHNIMKLQSKSTQKSHFGKKSDLPWKKLPKNTRNYA
ncbi:unnamed protein product [Moneuplotes crassus]|uniref:Uncharacterized protein n=1 Tax=Euplotes crassus TaxID=5936 RepID=A0AAD1UEV2_EUPCR|nr:unnamed protein product [Moneuplotes crassus]